MADYLKLNSRGFDNTGSGIHTIQFKFKLDFIKMDKTYAIAIRL